MSTKGTENEASCWPCLVSLGLIHNVFLVARVNIMGANRDKGTVYVEKKETFSHDIRISGS